MSSNNTFKLLYFAVFQEKAGKAEEWRNLPEDLTVSKLFESLCETLELDLTKQQVRVSINHQFSDWNTVILANDVVAFIPPVAGG